MDSRYRISAHRPHLAFALEATLQGSRRTLTEHPQCARVLCLGTGDRAPVTGPGCGPHIDTSVRERSHPDDSDASAALRVHSAPNSRVPWAALEAAPMSPCPLHQGYLSSPLAWTTGLPSVKLGLLVSQSRAKS